jgi:sulfonate transport system substrate-binding protein
MDRRVFLSTMAGAAAALGLAACGAGPSDATTAKDSSAKTGPLPTKVPPGTSLSVASADNGLNYKLAGTEKDFSFKVTSWPNLSAGPDVINAFRAHSLDVAFNAGIPAIQAYYQGDAAKIVSVGQNRVPNYIFLTKPHSPIQSVDEFRGKKLAFSQGQAQGVVLLRALNKAKIPFKDVTLVNLTSDQFLTALEASQVDIAPVSISQVPLYLDKYASEGAHTIKTDVIDFLDIIWAPADVLDDEAKVAAIVELIPLNAKTGVWTWTHKAEWVQEYYVKTQDLTTAQGNEIMALGGKPWYPTSWDAAIKWEQETADLLAEGGFVKKFDVSTLFDRRFEHLASAAVPATYRS